MKKLTKEEVIAGARIYAKPLDYGMLETKGLIKKAGAWYEVPNIHKLPKHVSDKITEVSVPRATLRLRSGRRDLAMKRTLLVLLLAGCASVNDGLTPSLRVAKDDFDGAVVARQPSVGASSTMSEGRHTLALDWNQRTPDTVYVTAGALGTTAITGLAFNVDGKVIENLKEASAVTDREFSRYGSWAERRFAMPWSDFLAILNARSVKMRVSRINDYSVSSFGPEHGGAIINTKLVPFAEKVRELRAALGRG